MPFPDPYRDDDEPEWKQTGLEIEAWILTVLIGGALVYGAALALIGLVAPWLRDS